jgi:hypothetical protein
MSSPDVVDLERAPLARFRKNSPEKVVSADEDLSMFAEIAEAQEVPTYAEDDIGRQLDEGLKSTEQLTAIRGMKISIKQEVARAMDLSVTEFNQHFIEHATEIGQRFKNV